MTEQDLLSISFDYAKTQADANKVLASLKEVLEVAAKVDNIKISFGDNAGRIAALTKASDDYAKTLNQVDTVLEKHVRKTNELSKSLEEQRFIRSKSNKELKATVEIEQTEANSIERARANLKGLNLLRNSTNTATKEGAEKLKLLNAEIDKNNKFIVANGDAALKQRANIGNYGSALNGVGASLKNIANGLLATIGVTAGLAGILSFFNDAIDEANQAEKSVSRLKNTLNNLGREDAFDILSDKANQLAKEFKQLDNDDILEVFQQLITYGKLTAKQMDDLLPVIINFSAKSGLSLSEGSSVIIKALEGNAKALKEYGINVKDGANVTERLGIVMTELKPKVEGAAEAFGKTFAGQAAIARQEINNIKEDLGNKLLPLISGFYSGLRDTFNGLSDIFSRAGDQVISLYNRVKNVVLLAKDLVTFNPGASSVRDAQFKAEEAAQLKAKQGAKDIAEIERTVSLYVSDAAKKSLKDQEKELIVAKAFKEAAFQKYDLLVRSGQLSSKEGKEATKDLAIQAGIVIQLQKLIATGKDKRILGIGDPDEIKKAKKEVKAFKDETLELEKDLSRFYAKMRALAIDNKDAIGPPTLISSPVKKQADDDAKAYDASLERRVRANDTAFANEQTALLENYRNGKTSKEDYEKDLVKITEKFSKQGLQIQIDELEAEKNFAFNGIEQTQDVADKKAVIEKKLSELKLSLKKQEKEDENVQANERLDKLKGFLDKAKVVIAEVSGLIGSLINISVTKQKNAIQELEDQQQKFYQNELERVKNSTLSEQDKSNRTQVLEAQRQAQKEANDRKNREAEGKRLRFDKAAGIATLTIETAIAVVRALGAKPFTPINIATAIAVGALGAAKIALAIATPIPKYATGTISHPGGPAIYGEAGSELVTEPGKRPYLVDSPTLGYLPRHTKVEPLKSDQVNSMMYNAMLLQTAQSLGSSKNKSDELLEGIYNELKHGKGKHGSINVKVRDNSGYNKWKLSVDKQVRGL